MLDSPMPTVVNENPETLAFHPISAIFPMMSTEEYHALRADISANGVREPIWLYQNQIIDGRNRYQVCCDLGIHPPVREWDGNGSLVAFVVSLNLHRRHLTTSQRAALAVELEPLFADEAKKRQLATLKRGPVLPVPVVPKSAQRNGNGKAREQAAKVVKVGHTGVSEAKKLKKEAPELFEQVKAGTATLQDAKKIAKRPEAAPEIIKRVAAGRSVTQAIKDVEREQDDRLRETETVRLASRDDSVRIELADMDSFLASLSSVDAIITDPPYPKEYLPLYEVLGQRAAECLGSDGVLAVMVGQSYLPEIIAAISKQIPYRWAMAYLTPGGQAVQVWPRKVNTFWKPVLLFGGAPDWIGDVVRSDVNDNDKRFHGWGQSESGMGRLVEAVSKPGMLVCDPFLGGGTTAVVCKKLGRRFVGCDIDEAAVKKSLERVSNAG
jgi:hypothetical protein